MAWLARGPTANSVVVGASHSSGAAMRTADDSGGGSVEERGLSAPDPAPPATEPSPGLLEERAWIERSKRGDRRAFTRIYERFAGAVHGLLLAWVRPQEVEDLLQEVFMKAWARIEALAEPAELGPWLCSIARNQARDHWRERGRSSELAAEEELVDARRAPSEAREEAEEARVALAAIRTLPEAYRETLVLRLVEGLSGPEIAARTGLTYGSVRVNLPRGMRLLREKLAERLA